MATPSPAEMNPQARGKAAALSAYLARKGSPRGNRLDRHVEKFEQMWVKAPGAVKDKYAARSQKTDLAPSERPPGHPPITNASLNASRPGETYAQTQARFRQARMAKTPPAAPAQRVPAAPIPSPYQQAPAGDPLPPPTEPTFRSDTRRDRVAAPEAAIGSDEARAAALSENSRNERFATADIGGGGMAAANAMMSAEDKLRQSEGSRPRGSGNPLGYMPGSANFTKPASTSAIVQKEIEAKSAADSKALVSSNAGRKQGKEEAFAASERKRLGLPASSVSVYSDEYSNGYLDAAAKGEKYPTRDEAGKPFRDPGTADGDTHDAEEATRQANNSKIEADNAAKGLSPLGGAVTPPSAVHGSATAAGKPPIAGPTASGATGINRLTGMPFGSMPGETSSSTNGQTRQMTPDQIATSKRMAGERLAQGRPTASPRDIAGADNAMRGMGLVPPSLGNGSPRATAVAPPVSRPVGTGNGIDRPRTMTGGVEGRAADEMRRQAGVNANPSQTNLDDPKKFFTGRTLPLNQLVKNQKPQGDGTPQPPRAMPVGTDSPSTTPAPATGTVSRVIAQRPATPEESRTGKVMPPVRRPVLAR